MAFISDATFSTQRKALLSLMDNLRDIDLENKLDLPRIVVLGNQSVGKSSLIEGIAGIQLPRGTGTVTRCAMEIRLHQSNEEWRASVKTQRKSNGSSNEAGTADFGGTITDKADIPDRLRRAQQAILNPGTAPADFLTSKDSSVFNSVGENNDRRFSNDIVILDIWDKMLTDLTFIDLPGIISNTRNREHKADIQLIRDMAASYLEGESVILLAISMSEDYEISPAVEMARNVDRDGIRTVGVLTKADRAKSAEEHWLPVLANSEAPLKYGYFATRHRDTSIDDEQKLDIEQLHGFEESFFKNSEPWCSADESLLQRMGTSKMVIGLSNLFARRILARLPDIKRKVTEQLTDTHLQLRAIAAQPNSLQTMASLCSAYEMRLGRIVQANSGDEQLVLSMNERAKQFRNELFSTCPRLLPFEKTTYETAASNDEKREPAPEKQEEHRLDADTFPSIIRVDDRDEPTSAYDPVITNAKLTKQNVSGLEDLRDLLSRAQARMLPGFIPFSVVDTLIKRSISQWPPIINNYLQDVKPLIEKYITEESSRTFGRYDQGNLHQLVTNTASDTLSRLMERARTSLTLLLQLDGVAYTQNLHYYTSQYEKLLAYYRDHRRQRTGSGIRYTQIADPRGGYVTEVTALQTLKTYLSAFNVGLSTKEDLSKLLETDEYDDELKLIASTHAYFKVAFKRAIDIYPRSLDESLLQPLAKEIVEDLQTALKLYTSSDAENRCAALLADTPKLIRRREQLRNHETMLSEVLKLLASFERQGFADPGTE